MCGLILYAVAAVFTMILSLFVAWNNLAIAMSFLTLRGRIHRRLGSPRSARGQFRSLTDVWFPAGRHAAFYKPRRTGRLRADACAEFHPRREFTEDADVQASGVSGLTTSSRSAGTNGRYVDRFQGRLQTRQLLPSPPR
jgi:hypothetical protein